MTCFQPLQRECRVTHTEAADKTEVEDGINMISRITTRYIRTRDRTRDGIRSRVNDNDRTLSRPRPRPRPRPRLGLGLRLRLRREKRAPTTPNSDNVNGWIEGGMVE